MANAVGDDSQSDLYNDAMLAISEERLDDAEQILTALMAAEPRHAGVWLDLAMLYCAAGNANAAGKLFTEIERRFAPPPPILDVMARQREAGCRGREAKQELALRAGRGHESNVNQGASNANFSFNSGGGPVNLVLLPEFLPRGDGFSAASLDFFRELSPGGLAGVLQLQTRRYDSLSAFDYSSVFAGAEQPLRLGGWRLRAAASAGMMTLGGRLYLRQKQLQLEAVPPLPLPPAWQLSGTGIYSDVRYPSLNGFDAQGRELRATLSYRKADVSVQASLGAVQDLARGQRPGGNRDGTQAGLQARMGLGRDVVGELSLQAQRWQGSRSYLPGLFDAPRVQTTQSLRLATVFPLGDEQALVVEYRHTRNAENFSIFNYRNRSVQVSWQWQPGKMP